MTGIYNEDCLNGLASLPSESVDCCITDPPYGIGYQSARRTDKTQWKPKIINDETPFIDWIEPLYGKMKDGGRLICFYRWDVQELFLEEIKRVGFDVKSQIVWDKVIHGMGDLQGEFAPQHELMIYATKGRYTFTGTRPKTIYKCQRVNPEMQIHPNEKPARLLSAIIRDISKPNDLILDCFGGSFSTAIAAHQEGRRYLSYELSKHYYNIGIENFRNKTQQQQLF